MVSSALEKLLALPQQYPRRALLLILLLVALLGSGLLRLSFTTDFRSYFSHDNPQLNAFEAMESVFANQDNLYFFVRNPEGSLFTPDGLALIAELTRAGWTLPGSVRVDSLQNFQFTEVIGDDLITADFYDPHTLNTVSHEQLTALAARLQRLPELNGYLISADTSASGVNVRIHLADHASVQQMHEVVDAGRQLINRLRAQYPQFQLLLGGSMLSNITLGDAIGQDIRSLLIISYAVMISLMVLLLRSFMGMVLVMAVISFSVIATMGLAGWLGLELTPPTGFVPTAIMTIAVADTVHILVSYYFFLRQGHSRAEAVRAAMRLNFAPVLITSVTTLVGVLCLNTSDSPPYRDMGNLIGVGVAFAWLFTLTFLPAALTLLPLPKRQQNAGDTGFMDTLANWIIRFHRPLLIGMLLLTGACATQISRITITERWHEFFDQTFEVRNTTDAIQDYLGGLHVLFMIADSGTADGINAPGYMTQLAAFTDWLRAQPEVAHVSTVSDIVKRLHRNLNNDDDAFYRIPDQRELIAQYLLLYEMSLPMGLGLDDTINSQHSATRMQVRLHRTDSGGILAMEQKANAWAAVHAPALHLQGSTGLDIVFANLTFRNIHAMLQGTGLALVMISLLLIAALRSWKMGLISMIPNILPALMAYGLWALMNGRVDTATSVVVCLCLGIVVDDTVHFLSKYGHARTRLGLSAEDAIRYSFHTVGVALLVTSVVLVSGFLVLEFSHFIPSANMGLLLALSIAVALLIDFLLLPPLLLFFEHRPGKGLYQPAGHNAVEHELHRQRTQ
ncbi:efflux RND transporter permease subunit [Thalassolituus sp. LLYu03]|uniref:efflux RND transporter permease subunit n=1 Tax=Thalassolituus sp. LLYu03 TaxID=3421656 RepID=UPI003D2A0E1F